MTKYKKVGHRHRAGFSYGYLYDVGILPDGTLHNPNNYPEDEVRASVLEADARRHERRSRGAKKAAVTRQRRTVKLVHVTAQRILKNENIGPRSHCEICGRGLSDQQSIERGIGSECWQDVLTAIERSKETVDV